MESLTKQAREAIDKGLFVDQSCAILSALPKEVKPKVLCNLSEERGDIVVVGCPNDRAAACTLNK